MVGLFGYSVSNSYIGIGVTVAVAIGVIWYFMKRGTGRAAEERQEEEETRQLELDEKEAEMSEKDEKKQCFILDGLFSEIMTILSKSGMVETADKLMEPRKRISYILLSLENEKMNVKKALQTFQELHALIKEFLSHLPTDNPKINSSLEEINGHQQRYYQDLIGKLRMDEKKKAILKELWAQVLDEESGSGQLKAA